MIQLGGRSCIIFLLILASPETSKANKNLFFCCFVCQHFTLVYIQLRHTRLQMTMEGQ